MRDWTGNTKSIYSAIGASNHAVNAEREINDFYATDPQCIDDLLKYEEFNFYIWEPACGQGHLSKRLTERGFRVYSTDLIDRGFGIPGVDFLKQPATGDKQTDIITNPPYKYAREFVQKSLDIIAPGCKAAFFLKLTFLEGQTRFEKLYKTAPPRRVYVYVRRQNCAKNGDFAIAKPGAVSYAWFIWEKGYKGEPVIKWIN